MEKKDISVQDKKQFRTTNSSKMVLFSDASKIKNHFGTEIASCEIKLYKKYLEPKEYDDYQKEEQGPFGNMSLRHFKLIREVAKGIFADQVTTDLS